ncbi:LysR substrate-binding domain-containing protein [Polaromonas sp. SM01]|uniref:LysR substrate-binding domain-containing protein n=1 Tax=Polaromonas sp. SM01 TaxID=3085630 RepID=UPI002980AD3C|nr:LysR substrate-binding domain-containing protein [Polaromonas sp. SM01]MDW5441379.1 LysR substrate-binding domain-containing protein [Polaromonas sp. SM01]
MQIKWLEDFAALAQTRNFSRAAELRHVTHPAFGRRIKALEAWAGTPLIERGSSPVTLTAAGTSLLDNAQQMMRSLGHAHEELLGAAGRQQNTVTLATGRTLARTLVADWLSGVQPLLVETGGELRILTRALADTVQLLERGDADFMLTYHHPLLALPINARQYSHLSLSQDSLVPVTRANALGQGQHHFQPGRAAPYLAYASTLALGRLVEDHLANNPHAPALRRIVECDSADALIEYALKGLGVAWLPRSMVVGALQAGQLVVAGDKRLEIRFEVRIYRAKRRLSPLAETLWRSFESS